jgi:hypothetical protein
MRTLLLLLLVILLSGCTKANYIVFDPTKPVGESPYCYVDYMSVFKDFNTPSMEVCGMTVGAKGSVVTEVDMQWLTDTIKATTKLYLQANGIPIP